MEGHFVDSLVEVGPNGRERYYDSRGYGRPRGDGVVLSPVEAAHLLYRGDLATVDNLDFNSFLCEHDDIIVPFTVYRDLRARGFYISPARDGWVADPSGIDFVVHPRGTGPWDGEVAYRIKVVGEWTTVRPAELDDLVLAVVDEESEVTYLAVNTPSLSGSNEPLDSNSFTGRLIDDRVVCPNPPSDVFTESFYGQWMGDGKHLLQLSLLEAIYLVEIGHLELKDGIDAVEQRGSDLEGNRFAFRRTVYRVLRDKGLVPKTGFKFGADFRTYSGVQSVEALEHSEHLVRVLPTGRSLSPQEIALDVRMAHGVRKRLVFAIVESDDIPDAAEPSIYWRTIERVTP